MKKFMSGALVALFIMGVSLFPGAHNTTVTFSQIHPMCWAGYCPDMRHAPGAKPVDPAADPPGDPTTPDPMGNVGF